MYNIAARQSDLIQKFIDRMGDQRKYEIRAEADEATIYLYDVIGEDWFGGISAKQFVADLAGITAGTIHVRINSPGGDVFDARAMQTALVQNPARIIAHIDGLAASAATYVMLGADEIEAVGGALFMIHNAWAFSIGNKADMRKMADTLDKIDDGIAQDYIDRTGQTPEQVRSWMDKETDFTAAEALEHGFIDRIYKSESKASKREAEKALRDAGFSATESKRILAEGFKGAHSRDVRDEPDTQAQESELAEIIRRATATYTTQVN